VTVETVVSGPTCTLLSLLNVTAIDNGVGLTVIMTHIVMSWGLVRLTPNQASSHTAHDV
jgi:hypothetical protein